MEVKMFEDYNKYGDAFNESNDVDELELYDMYENEREEDYSYFGVEYR